MLASLTAVERQALIMSVGVHVKRRRADPMRLARLLRKAHATGETLDEIADHVNLSGPTVLRKLLSLNKLPADVQNLIEWGSNDTGVSFSVAAEIARASTDADRRRLAQAAIEHRLSRSEVQAIVQRSILKGCDVRHATEEILRLRPEVEQRYLLIGLLDGQVPDDAARKNIRRSLAKLVGQDNVLAVRCGDGRFSVVLSAAGASSDRIRGHLCPAKLQTFINASAAA